MVDWFVRESLERGEGGARVQPLTASWPDRVICAPEVARRGDWASPTPAFKRERRSREAPEGVSSGAPLRTTWGTLNQQGAFVLPSPPLRSLLAVSTLTRDRGWKSRIGFFLLALNVGRAWSGFDSPLWVSTGTGGPCR